TRDASRCIQPLMQEGAEQAHITTPVYPHLRRPSGATTLRERGMPCEQRLKCLGHAKRETTQVWQRRARRGGGRCMSGCCHGEVDDRCASSGRGRILQSHTARAINGGELGSALPVRDLCRPRCHVARRRGRRRARRGREPHRVPHDTTEATLASPWKGGSPCTTSPCRNGPSTACCNGAASCTCTMTWTRVVRR